MDKKNIRFTLEFDGTDFNGYQIQDNKRTVQGVIEESLLSLTGEKIRVRGCSRTDSGVHARNYILNFYTDSTIPPEKFLYPMNNILPEDIRIKKSEEVPMDFDSRKNAAAKIYSYRFLNSKVEPVIGRQYISNEKIPLDIEKMKEAVEYFKGEHDFRAFMSQGSEVKGTVRTIYSAELTEKDNLIIITLKGNSFLYNMVRIIAGTLIFIGQGTRTKDDILTALSAGDRSKAGKVAPAKCLTLESVIY